MKNIENLGDWCKWLETNFSPEIMIPKLPVIIRLDGCNFSNWTKNLEKPFDEKFNQLLQDLCKELVQVTGAKIGYCSSDEITLILYSDDLKKPVYHSGKKQKILSKLTSHCSNWFNANKDRYVKNATLAEWDCRIYQTPSIRDAGLQLLWRERDCTRNSVYLTAFHEFSHNVLQNLNSSQLQEKLFQERGINWNDKPVDFKRGSYFKQKTVSKKLTLEELETLPPLHNARKNPDLEVERRVLEKLDLPPLNGDWDWESLIF
jgi:tRNA(His) guanylyltransferase